jgi:hypothetical protein
VVEQVYPALRLVPGFILAPKWSRRETVAARMATLARSINGAFRAMALTTCRPTRATSPLRRRAGVEDGDNGYTSVDSCRVLAEVKNGDDVYHASTVMACVANLTDAAQQRHPVREPEQQGGDGTSAVLDDGTEVLLTAPQANALNDQGIVTLLNGFNGWRLWGNRTGGYPGTTDPKDAFIPIRRMFNWIGNTIILTTDANVDDPGNRRLIDLVLGTLGVVPQRPDRAGALVDGKIEFRKDENPVTDLADGKIKWHVTLTPPSPARSSSSSRVRPDRARRAVRVTGGQECHRADPREAGQLPLLRRRRARAPRHDRRRAAVSSRR